MSSQIMPIKLWGFGQTANPLKVALILEELGLPWENVPVAMSDIKKPEYLAVNPNGRLPSIQDPNTGLTVWESGAIIEYLIETYDKDRRISFAPGTPEFWHARQWLYFQATGQGPYYGQAAWFKIFHAEKIPSAIERYYKEAGRVSGVLDAWLAEQERQHGGSGNSDNDGSGPWLVGNKLSYADIAFIPWQSVIMAVTEKEDYDQENFPHLAKWYQKIAGRDLVKKTMERARQSAAH